MTSHMGEKGVHTRGPWETERVYLTLKDPTMRITARDGALYIAEAAYSTQRSSDSIHVTDADEMRANARLIAAAPDLIEALQALVDEYQPNLKAFATDAPRKAKWMAALSAIAKATGSAAT